MANNRMYLVNKTTGVRIYLAKYYPSTGWYAPRGIESDMNAAFDKSDFGHLSEEERKALEGVEGCGPFAQGGMYGAGWVLEYEE